MSTTYALADGGRTLLVSGDLLAKVSSKDHHKSRWAEFVLVRLASGGYVIQKSGVSRVPGEVDRHTVMRCPTPASVVQAMHRKTSKDVSYLPHINEQLLIEASKKDVGISQAYYAEAL